MSRRDPGLVGGELGCTARRSSAALETEGSWVSFARVSCVVFSGGENWKRIRHVFWAL
jgi:hypothetical protein